MFWPTRPAAWRNRNGVAKTAACGASYIKETPTHTHAFTKSIVSEQQHVHPHGGGGEGGNNCPVRRSGWTCACANRTVRPNGGFYKTEQLVIPTTGRGLGHPPSVATHNHYGMTAESRGSHRTRVEDLVRFMTGSSIAFLGL